MGARAANLPRFISVSYRGIPYVLDLLACRRALVERQIEGEVDSMESLAASISVSRSTVSRFFSGRRTSLSVTLRILRGLRLVFDDVARRTEDQDALEGPPRE